MNGEKIIRVKDVMTGNYQIVDGLTTVDEGMQIMRDSAVRTLIIKKRDQNDAFGLVLISDIGKNVLAKNRSPKRVSLYEIMSKPVVWVEPEMNIRYCARLFLKFGFAIAPVVEKGEIVGIVSYHDMVLNGLTHLDD